MVTLGNTDKAIHAYEIEVSVRPVHAKQAHVDHIIVHADNRTQASHIATKAGYVVRSVNMVG